MSIFARNIGIIEMNQEKGFALSILAHLIIVAGLFITTSSIKPSPKLMVVDFNILENYVTKTTTKQIQTAQQELKPQKVAAAQKTQKPIPVDKKIRTAPKPIPASKPQITSIKQKKPVPVKAVPESTPELIPEVVRDPPPKIKEEAPQQITQNLQPVLTPKTDEKTARRIIPKFPAPAAGKPKNIQSKDTVSAYTKAQFKHIQQNIQQLINYPRTARRMGWEGKVVLEFIICKDGTVKDIGIIESSGFKALDKNAVATIKKASPFPIPPIAAKLIIPVVYRLS